MSAAGVTGSFARRLLVGSIRALLFPVVAIVLALVIGAIIVAATGNNPAAAYGALLDGAFGSAPAVGRTLVNATPLVLTGLAFAIPFRASMFNIGGEGQLFIGAITAAALGTTVAGSGVVWVAIIILACLAAGFLWGAIPGLLKARFGAHEVITTIMLNYVGINLAYWLAQHPFSGHGTVPGTGFVSARLAYLGGGLGQANYGSLVAILAAVAAYLLLWRTTLGYTLRAVGHSPEAARYAGMSLGLSTTLAMAIGGAFAAVGGGIEVIGTFGSMSVPFVSNLGFNGIGVAMLGRNHPAGIVLGALLLGALQGGAQQMQFATQVPLDLANVIIAIILLFVTAVGLVELLIGRKRLRAMLSGRRGKEA
ncbi:ABC transporter permease [Rubrobacter naiadicus]|uniref:ABC transporter permease n=1 Tax=Rubrobacter naiadicus TaxID=1392641 RepID=UPI00235E069B|nr:ABC transporter permease [Rubrobacter naiadicus]